MIMPIMPEPASKVNAWITDAITTIANPYKGPNNVAAKSMGTSPASYIKNVALGISGIRVVIINTIDSAAKMPVKTSFFVFIIIHSP